MVGGVLSPLRAELQHAAQLTPAVLPMQTQRPEDRCSDRRCQRPARKLNRSNRSLGGDAKLLCLCYPLYFNTGSLFTNLT